MKMYGLLLAACAAFAAIHPLHAATPAKGDGANDPYLWLEKTHGERAMQWVHQQNARTEKQFASGAAFDRMRQRVLEVMDSDARIPGITRRGGYLYNFWQDKAHPRGIWRRTTLAEYRKPDPKWQVLLDIDALNKAEGRKWVFKGADCMKPAYTRCLVQLSPGGGDAVQTREFDIPSRSFVKGGFVLPVAKTFTSWIDRDHIFVGTDFGPGSMTASSYPRIVKEWTRGTPLSAARTVYTGKPGVMLVSARHDRTRGYQRSILQVVKDFFHSTMYQLKDGKRIKIDVPEDAMASVHRQWLTVITRSPWTVAGKTWPTGALLVANYADFMAGKRAMTPLFLPDAHTALESISWTRHHLIAQTLKDVQSQLVVLTPGTDGAWSRQPLAGTPPLSTVSVADTDPDADDAYWLDVTGYLTPPALERGVIGQSAPEVIKQSPAFFDASRFTVSQHFATSRDGTRVPYFEIAPKNMKADGSNPTILYGYGGFAISLLPRYSGNIGRAWLERGGVYVVANIRGGGEYGPRWHKAAMKANRPKAYQDFAAVARDLVKRGVTSPAHLGALGGSNGGLLVGNMLVSYPKLFGAIGCEVPLLDMKRYIYLDAGASWVGEYGNPEDPKQWAYIRHFSPYQLVHKDRHYPPVLFYTTTSDDRVGPAQARKMAAKMEGMGYQDVWFFENTEGGHGAGADNQQASHMYAMVYGFLWDQLK